MFDCIWLVYLNDEMLRIAYSNVLEDQLSFCRLEESLDDDDRQGKTTLSLVWCYLMSIEESLACQFGNWS